MQPDRARELIEQIAASEPERWDCDSIHDALARFVDEALSSDRPRPADPDFARHLERCPPCGELYEGLLAVARLDQEPGGLPSAAELWKGLSDPEGEAQSGSQASPRPVEPSSIVQAPDSRSAPEPGGGARHIYAPPWWVAAAALLLLGFGLWGIARGTQRLEAQQLDLIERVDGLRSSLTDAEARALRAERSAERSNEALQLADQEARKVQDTLMLLGHLDRLALDQREDGAWLRLHYRPDDPRAVVYVGNMDLRQELSEGQYLECWLQGPDGQIRSAGVTRLSEDALRPAAAVEHWTIEAPRPMGEHRAFMVTIEPEHEPIFELALAPDG